MTRTLTRLLLLLSVILLYNSYFVAAQTARVPLREFLIQTGKERKIHFSFLDEDLSGMVIDQPTAKLNITELLSLLKRQTNLTFSIVSEGYIVVYKTTRNELFFCGFIKDKETQEAIAGATIHGEHGEYSISDELGFFKIRLSQTSLITFSHLSYKAATQKNNVVKANECLTIFLEKDVRKLEGVVVNHFLTRGIRVKADRSYNMLPRQAGLLPGLTEPDVLQTLQQLPGIVSIDQSVSNISVRSGSHDQNIFLWNGIRLFEVGHFFGLISAFNPNLPHSVTAYKNATPARFGESVSGTILIDSPPDTIGAKEHSSIGLNMVNADFNTAFRTGKKTSWQLSGRRSITDIFHSPVYDRYHERVFQNTKVTNFFADQVLDYNSEESFNFYDLTAQVKHEFDSLSSVNINFITIGKELAITQKADPDSAEETSGLTQRSLGANISYQRSWSKSSYSQVAFSFSRYNLDSEDFHIDEDQVTVQENKVEDLALQISHRKAFTNGITARANYMLNNINISNLDRQMIRGSERIERNSLLTQSLAIQADARISRILFVAGLRNQYYARFKTFRAEPRLSVSWYAREQLTFTVSGETKSQVAYQQSERQQDFLGIESRRWKLANETDIPLLRSQQLSLQGQYQRSGWLFTAEAFVKKVDGITSMSQDFQNQFADAIAVGDYTVNGFEFLLQKQYKKLTGWINFQLNNSDYHFASLEPGSFTNNYEIPEMLRFGLVYGDQKWGASVGGLWSAGRHYTQPISRIPGIAADGSLFIRYTNPNENQLNDNVQLNLSGSRIFRLSDKWKLRCGIAMQNLLNYSSVINRRYRINRGSETIEEIDDYNLARTLNIFVRLLF